VGPPQSSVPAPDTAPAPAPATAPTPGDNQQPAPVTAPTPGDNQQPAPASGADQPPAPFSAGPFPIFVKIPPPLTEITDAAPPAPSTVSNVTANATVPIIDYHLYITDCHYGCSAAYSFSAVIAVIIMSAVAFVILHVTRKRKEHAEEEQIQVQSFAESDPSIVKYQPPISQRFDGVSKPNEFKRRSDFGTPQDYNEYDLRKPNPYGNQPPPVPYGVAGVAPAGMGYLYGEQGRTSEDTTQMTDEEYLNMDTPHYGGVGGFAGMLPPPPPPPTHIPPPGESPTSPEFHHERDSDYSMPFGHHHQPQQHDEQHLHALHPDHPGDSPISATGTHFNIGPPRPAPPPPSQPPDILAPRAQFNPILLPLPPASSPPPPVMAQEMQPQQPQFLEVVPDEYEGYFVEGEEYEFHPQQYEDDHQWFADGGGGEDLDVGQYYAPHQQSFDHDKRT